MKYLSENIAPPFVSDTSYDLLNTDRVLLSEFNEYLIEMESEDFIKIHEMSGHRKILFIMKKGIGYLHNGGYSQDAKDELNEEFEGILEVEKKQDKLDLEITNLRESIKHYRGTRIRSNWALLISIISIITAAVLKFIFK